MEKESNQLAPEPDPTAKERYELLVRARNFHYENYNKWMTYFYVAISAIFISFFTIHSKPQEEIHDKFFIEIVLLTLGYIVSLLWYWSCKGYYFWNINFISLVNYYETEVFKWENEKRIYNLFYDKSKQNNYGSPISGANISTSKVAILFAYIVSFFFGFLIIYTLIKTECECRNINIFSSALTAIALNFVISHIIPRNFLYSKIDEMAELKNNLKL